MTWIVLLLVVVAMQVSAAILRAVTGMEMDEARIIILMGVVANIVAHRSAK